MPGLAASQDEIEGTAEEHHLEASKGRRNPRCFEVRFVGQGTRSFGQWHNTPVLPDASNEFRKIRNSFATKGMATVHGVVFQLLV
jgi:hypothetical protein